MNDYIKDAILQKMFEAPQKYTFNERVNWAADQVRMNIQGLIDREVSIQVAEHYESLKMYDANR